MLETIAESIAGHAQTLAIRGSKHCTAGRLVGHAMKRYDVFESFHVVEIIYFFPLMKPQIYLFSYYNRYNKTMTM